MQYKLLATSEAVLRTDDNGVVSYIPPDELNKDWQAYQSWLAIEGNTPLPAEGA